MSVITDEEAKINELFIRLNRSKPLTGAEIRNAMSGIVPDLIRRVSAHSFFQTNIRFATRRGQDKNTAAKLLLLEFRGKFVDTKKINLDRFAAESMNSETDNFSIAANKVEETLSVMAQIFTPRDKLLSSQGQLPVYYWLVKNGKDFRQLREFLVAFEKERTRNRTIAKEQPDKADQELLAFDVMNRSTNDQASLQGRYEILEKRLELFRVTSHGATSNALTGK